MSLRRSRFVLLVTAACTPEWTDEPVGSVTEAHRTTNQGETTWVRMLGGPGVQRWYHVDAHEASRLTWALGLNDGLYQVVAYDPYRSRVIDVTYGERNNRFENLGLAAGHDDSRTMTRAGLPDGFGCTPSSDPLVTELA